MVIITVSMTMTKNNKNPYFGKTYWNKDSWFFAPLPSLVIYSETRYYLVCIEFLFWSLEITINRKKVKK